MVDTQNNDNLIRASVCQNLNDNDFAAFKYQFERTKLDPMTRQIYAVMRGGKMSVQTSIDGFRLIAERSGDYAGQQGPFWCGKDGVWRDVWLDDECPAAAKIGVWRSAFKEPCWGVARFSSYAQMNSPMWKKMPDVMIAKCAEALALRKAFPQELSGLYTSDEMMQANNNGETAPQNTETKSISGACKKDGSRNKDWKGPLGKDQLHRAYLSYVNDFEESQSVENIDELSQSDDFKTFFDQAESDWPNLLTGWKGPEDTWNTGVRPAYDDRRRELKQLEQ